MSSSLSVWEKLDLVPAFIVTVCVGIYAAITAPLRNSNTPQSFKTHVTLAISRKAFARLSSRQRQQLTGSTESAYSAWVGKSGFQSEISNLGDGVTKALWVGPPTAEYVVLYLHGGGWSMAAGSGHFEFAASVVRQGEKNGKSISFAFVQYELSPKAQYPYQISQCVELLRYSLDSLAKEPSKVFLVGDSSGGNLVMSVISHLLHPHPEIKPVTLSSPLKGLVVMSPWLRFAMQASSVNENRLQDPVSTEVMRLWGREYLGAAPADNYNQPGLATVDWWRGIPVEQLLVTGAAQEMVVEDIVQFSEKMKHVHPNTKVFFAESDIHAQPVIGPQMGLNEGEQGGIIREWMLLQLD